MDTIQAAASTKPTVHSPGVSSCRQKPEFLLLFGARPAKRVIQENKQFHSPHMHFVTSLGQRHGACMSTGRARALCSDQPCHTGQGWGQCHTRGSHTAILPRSPAGVGMPPGDHRPSAVPCPCRPALLQQLACTRQHPGTLRGPGTERKERRHL